MSADRFIIADDTYEDHHGRVVRVAVLTDRHSGELAEILFNTPGGDNRSNGSGGVNGLLLRDAVSGELREIMPYRKGFVGGLMAPFANRVSGGAYSFGGERHQLFRNWDEVTTRITRTGQHAIHGLLPRELVQVGRHVTEGEARLTLGASFAGEDEGYPFLVDVEFTYCLSVERGFSIHVAATNRASNGRPAPFMVGWHPYFLMEGPVDEAVLAFDRRSAFIRSIPVSGGGDGRERDSHPTGRSEPSTDFTQGRSLGHNYWDDGFKAIASTLAVPQLETSLSDSAADGEDSLVVLWQDAQCRFIQVYTGLRERGAIAIEPMSGQTDCFNNGDGLVVLQAGETWETAFGVRLAPRSG
ncbi:MAG: hypothetical protein AAF513_03050 [Pseudomonadota bacterium]